jgi:hypothetical protein
MVLDLAFVRETLGDTGVSQYIYIYNRVSKNYI